MNIAIKLQTSIKIVSRHEILPFPEKPSTNQFGNDNSKYNALKATDLFSKFTADIIKQNVIFTR